jgi:hypothetical protein
MAAQAIDTEIVDQDEELEPSPIAAAFTPSSPCGQPVALEEPVASPSDPRYVSLVRNTFPPYLGLGGIDLPLAEHRAISLSQLRRVASYVAEHSCKWIVDDPVPGAVCDPHAADFYQLTEWVLFPATQDEGCSFVELLAEDKQLASWHVSHSWSSSVLGCWECIELHAETRMGDEANAKLTEATPYWLYATSRRPPSMETSPVPVLKPPPTKAEFYMPMQSAAGCLLIASSGDEIAVNPFTRIWCLFETWTCSVKMHKLLDIATYHGSGTHLLTDGLTPKERRMERVNVGDGVRHKYKRETGFPVDCQNLVSAFELNLEETIASDQDDRTTILNWISGRDDLYEDPLLFHHTYTRASQRLRSHIATLL